MCRIDSEMPDEQTRYPMSFVVASVIIEVIELLKTALRTGGWVGVVYFGLAVPIRVTAGEETVITVIYQAVVSMTLHVILPYAAAAGAIFAWWKEHRARAREVRRLYSRNQELEKLLQKNRGQTTSSGGT